MQIVRVDFEDPVQAADFISLMSQYALDPMGGGKDLSPGVRAELPGALAQRPGCVSFIAYVEGQAAGLITCMEGFSTFSCKPLMNIHDVIVRPEYRGRKIADKLLVQAEQEAIARGCCKLTLEVLAANNIAKKVYSKAGFAPYVLDPASGPAEFWQKPL